MLPVLPHGRSLPPVGHRPRRAAQAGYAVLCAGSLPVLRSPASQPQAAGPEEAGWPCAGTVRASAHWVRRDPDSLCRGRLPQSWFPQET